MRTQKNLRRYPSSSQLISAISLLTFPPAHRLAACLVRCRVLGSQESLAGAREEAVSTKAMGCKRETRTLAEHLRTDKIKKNVTTSLGNPSEEMRQLQSSSGLIQDGGLNAK